MADRAPSTTSGDSPVPGIGVSTEDLEHVRAHLAAVIDSSEDAIASKTLEGIVTSWNASAERLFGYTAEEMIGQSITRIIPPELRDEETMILAKLRAGHRIERYESVRMHKDGHRLEISLTISPIRDRNGRIVGAAKIAHDITARVRAERALAEEARALETLNQIGQAVASQLDLERIVQIMTDGGRELTGAAYSAFFYNVVEGSTRSYWLYALSGAPREAFASFPMPRNTELFAPTFSGAGAVRSPDITKDPRYGKNAPYAGMPPGHLPVCSYLAVPVVSHTGEVIGGLFFGHPQPNIFTERAERLALAIAAQAAIAIDNSRLFQRLRDREAQLKQLAAERQQVLESERVARSEAERLSHLKDEFLATLSHELRTPLSAIQGWASLLRQRDVSPEDRERGLETIERNVRAQTQIVNDLLDMSRIISGKIHLEVQPLYLHEVINNAIEAVRQSAAAKHIRITPMLDSSIGLVRGDPNRLQQVLWNLLSNAVKFTPNGGRVQVILERVNSHVEIVVEDTGVGIKPDFLPHVFDRFRQGDPTTTRRYGGLGLGLSIVKSLVELHGGSVRVKSPGENQGSTFVVVLPVSHVQEEDVSHRHRTEIHSDPLQTIELPRLNEVDVLIVDDEPDGRALIARILDGRGARTTCATSAEEALQRLRERQYDILLSDIGMPDMDGYELMRQVRNLDTSRASPIPAIAVTAYARAEDRQRSLLAGYQMHLSKPIEARELIAAISSLLRLSR
ncbi:MAG: PAS domain S-box protein [Steroidobacteraceae bacterium]|nr:PAS domain S-box protein [Steroidobacteraceae bacterium]